MSWLDGYIAGTGENMGIDDLSRDVTPGDRAHGVNGQPN